MATVALIHDKAPGVVAYIFDDGSCVLADQDGNESPVQNFKASDFKVLGWKVSSDDAVGFTMAQLTNATNLRHKLFS